MRVEEGETAKSMNWEGRFLDAKNGAAEFDESTVFVTFVTFVFADDVCREFVNDVPREEFVNDVPREAEAAIAAATSFWVCTISCAWKYWFS